MNAAASKHPPREFLQAFGLGKLDDVAANKVSLHLETCADCTGQVAELSSDSLLEQLKRAHNPLAANTPAPSETLTPRAPAQKLQPANPPSAGVPTELLNNAQYEIIKELGAGGMGVVYLAKNKLMDRLEVLKVISTAMIHKASALDRFLREIRSAAALSHDNVVKAYSALQFGELLVFAMEYVEGDDLSKVVKTQGQLPIANACFYVRQVALGLQHAHEKNMVHRDIKPHNLILARVGKKHMVKILDFGLAKASSEKKQDYGLTGEGKMLGTPDYMAPEQIQDAATADIRADIYSLGCTLYYFLTGGTPFNANSLYGLLQAHQTEEAKSVNLVRPEVPMELGAIVAKMMAKDPAKRYQKPLEVAQALLPFVKPGAKVEGAPAALAESVKAARPRDELATKHMQTMMPEPPPLAAPVVQTKPAANAFTFEAEPVAKKPAAKKAKTKAPRRFKPAILAGPAVAVGLVLVGFLVFMSGVLRVQTQDGTIVIENLPPDAEVIVDGDTVTVKSNDGKTFEVRINAGKKKHRLEVRRNGVKVFGDEFEVDAGGRRFVSVSLEQQGIAKGSQPAPGTEKQPLGTVDGKVLTPQKMEVDPFQAGSVWKGTLSYRKGLWAGTTVPYEVRIDQRVGKKFKGRRFDSGPNWYRGEIEGEVNGNIATWRESAFQGAPQRAQRFVQGNRAGDTIRVMFKGDYGNGRTIEGDGELKVVSIDGVAPPPAKAEVPALTDGFAPLFNGKDLTGWTYDKQMWQVKDGLITNDGKNAAVILYDKAVYRDFHLRVEVQPSEGQRSAAIVFRNAVGNSSYFYRSNLAGPFAVAGDLRVEPGRNLLKGPDVVAAVKPGEWYVQDIVMKGNQLTVYVNGQQVLAYIDNERAPRPGTVGFYVNGGAKMSVRSVKIRDLTAQSPAPKTVDAVPPKIEADGFLPLFNGKNLAGWRTTNPALPGTWSVENGCLVGRGIPKRGHVSTQRAFLNFHLRVETVLSQNFNGALEIRGVDLKEAGRWNYNIMLSGTNTNISPLGNLRAGLKLLRRASGAPPLKRGEWFTFEMIAVGNHFEVLVNGKKAIDYVDQEHNYFAAPLTLTVLPNSTIKFRKIEIKELTPVKAEAVSATPAAPLSDERRVWTHSNGKFEQMNANLWREQVGKSIFWFREIRRTPNLIELHRTGEPGAKFRDCTIRLYRGTATIRFDAGPFTKMYDGAWNSSPKNPVAPPAETARSAVPEAEKVLQAEKAIRNQFKMEYAKKANANLFALAEKLLNLAKETKDDPASRYALLCESRSLAVKTGRIELAMKAASELSALFELDDNATKIETIVALSKVRVNLEVSKNLVELAFSHAAAMLAEDMFTETAMILTAADTVARRTKSDVLMNRVQKQAKLSKEIAKEHAEMKKAEETLSKDTNDPAASLAVGTYFAFRKGDWDKALPLLARSSHADLRDLAKKDLAVAENDKAHVEMGDAWWTAAEKKMPPHQKIVMQWRAAFWYRPAMPNLTGLTQTRVAACVKQVDDRPAPFRVIAPKIKRNTDQFTPGSVWSGSMVFLNGGTLKAPANQPFNIRITLTEVKNGVFEGEYVAPGPPPQNQAAIRVRGQYDAAGNFTMKWVNVTRGDKKAFIPMTSQGFATGMVSGGTIRARYTEAIYGLVGQMELKLLQKKN